MYIHIDYDKYHSEYINEGDENLNAKLLAGLMKEDPQLQRLVAKAIVWMGFLDGVTDEDTAKTVLSVVQEEYEQVLQGALDNVF